MVNVSDPHERAVIRPIKRAMEDHLLGLPGVVAVDIGEKRVRSRPCGELAIVVSVARKQPESRLPTAARVPPGVLGVPTDVVEERAEPHHDERHVFAAVRGVPPCAGLRTVIGGEGLAPYRCAEPPSPGGVRVARRRVGTLGALALGRAPSAVPMGLTTFDVACVDDAWSVGDRMIDPSSGLLHARLTRAALSSKVDAAAITLDGGIGHSCVVAAIGPITGQCAARTGETVWKAGYGTGFTAGVVASTDATVRVDHGRTLGARVLREQVRVTAGERFAGPGDSGAVLVNVDGRVVGLHVAGSPDGRTGFACPIADVLDELDVELCVASHRLVSGV